MRRRQSRHISARQTDSHETEKGTFLKSTGGINEAFPSSTQDLWWNTNYASMPELAAAVSALESRYGIFVDVDEITVDNFRNLAAIKVVLARKGINL